MSDIVIPSQPHAATTRSLQIRRGTCYALFAFDIGLAIDLNQAESILARHSGLSATTPSSGPIIGSEQRETIRGTRRSPRYFQFTPAPLRIAMPGESVSIGPRVTSTAAAVTLYDFGAASIEYTIPIATASPGGVCDLVTLLNLSSSLYENHALLADAHKRVAFLSRMLAGAVTRPELAEIVEDYAVFVLQDWSCDGSPSSDGRASRPEPMPLIREHALALARILRAEPALLSDQESAEAISSCISYTQHDAAILDWNAAILFDPDPREAQDTLAALEFANVELLEMRHLDDRLDSALDTAYEVMNRRRTAWWARGERSSASLTQVSQLQAESAMLFEGVNNAIKLLGDQYLARVYRTAAQRFHLGEWDANILRKLGTLEGIYQKLSDRQSARRMETMEIIVIVLIAVEVLMGLVPRFFGK